MKKKPGSRVSSLKTFHRKGSFYLKGSLCAYAILLSCTAISQTVAQDIGNAFSLFESDSQLKNATSSLYVIDAKTGAVVFDHNSRMGLAPASTQKIITSISAFEILGKDYRYKTKLGYTNLIEDGVLRGNLILEGSGDPTFGSWRYKGTTPEYIFNQIKKRLEAAGIKKVNGPVLTSSKYFETQQIPGGWIWDDIANYYGAGGGELNWQENQYDLILKPGKKIGDSVSIIRTSPMQQFKIVCEVRTAAANTGDNAYLYFEPSSELIYVRGTIPCCVDSFTISGSVPNGGVYAGGSISEFLASNRFQSSSFSMSPAGNFTPNKEVKNLYTHFSPPLDSIIYWFNKKSINLYGEALIKTIAYERQGFGRTDSGINIVKKFWKEKGLDENELNIYDGSGLSPLNRVTTHLQVEILRYAKSRQWFPYFYAALPEFNNMKMKSGTINDVKGFCGYHTAKDGKEYIFSFLVNNYNGKSSQLVTKMYKVLDKLK